MRMIATGHVHATWMVVAAAATVTVNVNVIIVVAATAGTAGYHMATVTGKVINVHTLLCLRLRMQLLSTIIPNMAVVIAVKIAVAAIRYHCQVAVIISISIK